MSKSGWTMSLNLNMLDTDNGQQKNKNENEFKETLKRWLQWVYVEVGIHANFNLSLASWLALC